MSSGTTQANIHDLLAQFNVEIKMLPDHLKCAECKCVLKDACQVPCGCRFCRACIDDVMARGGQFCPGGAQECDNTSLSAALPDYNANKSISRLTAKCPMPGCPDEFQLADIESHLQVCQRKSVHCPFRDFGCEQGQLAPEEMSGHLLQESRGHSEMLVETVANINKNVEVLQRELVQKDEQMRTIVEEMRHVQNEIKSIKLEKEALSKLVRQSGKLESAQVKNQIQAINSNIDSLKSELQSTRLEKKDLSDRVSQLSKKLESAHVKNEIQSINQNMQSINGNIDSIKSELQSTRLAVGLARVDACFYDWLIHDDIEAVEWSWGNRKTSTMFTGRVHPYRYQLAAVNNVSRKELLVYLHFLAGPNDSSLHWPFKGAVTIKVADRHKREAHNTLTQRCEIRRSFGNNFKCSDRFEFPHSDLDEDGVDLELGVLVSCEIVPDEAL